MRSTAFLFLMSLCFANGARSAEVEEENFWAAVRTEWGQYATPDKVAMLYEDVTCDGVADYVGSYLNLDNPEGATFNVMVVTGGPLGITQGTLYFPFDDGSEKALSMLEGATSPPLVELEPWEQEGATSNFGVDVCNVAIKVSDGVTDSPRLFWRKDSPAEEERLLFYRN